MLDLDTGKIENLTNDAFADYGPTFSPDGSYIVYMARVSGNEKLFRLDLDTKKKTQLTYGTHDDAQAKFVDDHTLVFPSTAVNPTLPIEPEVAKNGNIFNIWTLDLKTGELRQFTDAVGGNVNPIVLQGERTKSIAFVTLLQGRVGRPRAGPEGPAADGAARATSASRARGRPSTSRRRSRTRS